MQTGKQNLTPVAMMAHPLTLTRFLAIHILLFPSIVSCFNNYIGSNSVSIHLLNRRSIINRNISLSVSQSSSSSNHNNHDGSSYKEFNDHPIHEKHSSPFTTSQTRRNVFQKSLNTIATTTTITALLLGDTMDHPLIAPANAAEEDKDNKYAPKFVQTYEDFIAAPDGCQYKDVKIGTGDVSIEEGDRVVYDWSGYTIGYFGRPFEAKGGPQGGAFDKDLDYRRTVIGSHTVVPGLEKAFLSMKPGGVRQVIVPYGPLSYPPNDLEHTNIGPKPSTFSGQRALNFVLENPRVDRTLLFNIKLIRVDKSNGNGGFIRG